MTLRRLSRGLALCAALALAAAAGAHAETRLAPSCTEAPQAWRLPTAPECPHQTLPATGAEGRLQRTISPAGETSSAPLPILAKPSRDDRLVVARTREDAAAGPLVTRAHRLSREALSYRGSRYAWGGVSRRSGFDCSGFTRYLYLKQGIDLPHSAKLQFQLGRRVLPGDLKPGDLVFFDTRGPLSHVGMYLGNGKFIHASSPKRGVRIDSLSAGFYKKRFVGARRYT